MKKDNQLEYSTNVFMIPFLMVFGIWFVYYLELRFGWNFNKLGVYPRTLSGLKGIFFSPFIHSTTKHLFNNSIPLFVLTASLLYFYKRVAFKVLLYGTFITELLTWIIGRESYHIGASGLVYALFSFIFFSGVIKKHFRLIAVSLIVIFLYGSMIWYVLPIKVGMSWEGHLSGFVVGLGLAILYRKQGIVKEKFEFSKTEFDTMFDENGNYVPPVVEEEVLEETVTKDIAETVNTTVPKIKIVYEIKKEEK